MHTRWALNLQHAVSRASHSSRPTWAPACGRAGPGHCSVHCTGQRGGFRSPAEPGLRALLCRKSFDLLSPALQDLATNSPEHQLLCWPRALSGAWH